MVNHTHKHTPARARRRAVRSRVETSLGRSRVGLCETPISSLFGGVGFNTFLLIFCYPRRPAVRSRVETHLYVTRSCGAL